MSRDHKAEDSRVTLRVFLKVILKNKDLYLHTVASGWIFINTVIKHCESTIFSFIV